MDLDAVANQLYGGHPPERFVALRDANALQARAGGQAELAEQIHALRKPTVSAWLANLLAHQRRTELTQFLELGDALRQAAARLDGERLRALTWQRRQVVLALVDQARRLAGRPVTAQVAAELEHTLEAALTDADAATQLRAGRLTRPLAPSTGLFEVGRASLRPAGPAAERRGRVARDARRSSRLDAAARRAEQELPHIRQQLSAAEDALMADRIRAAEAARRVRELELQLTDARRDAAAGQDAVAAAEQRRAQTQARLDLAQARLDLAQARLDRDKAE